MSNHHERHVSWEPWAGIGFAVLYFIGMAVLPNTPDSDAPDSKWTSFFASSGHRAAMVVSGFVLVFAALCLASFITGLWRRAAARSTFAGSNPLPLVAAAISAACIAAAGVMNTALAGGIIFGGMHEPPAELLRFSDNYSFPMATVGGLIAAALAVATISRQAQLAGIFGTKLTVFSYVMAAVSVASFLWIPQAAMLIWFLVVSIALLRRRSFDEPDSDGSAPNDVQLSRSSQPA